jgi:hypothetical protein
VVVDDLDVVGCAVAPHEAHAPLIVDANAVLPCPITSECLQPIARRHAQVIQPGGDFQLLQLAQRGTLDVDPPFDAAAFEQRLVSIQRKLLIATGQLLTLCVNNVKHP